jgi:hypothetical protein
MTRPTDFSAPDRVPLRRTVSEHSHPLSRRSEFQPGFDAGLFPYRVLTERVQFAAERHPPHSQCAYKKSRAEALPEALA